MYKIRNNQIFLTRGDSACIILTIEDDDGNEYTPSANDTITFTVKKSPYNKKVLIQHTFSNNELIISPEDTMNLEYGDYVFDVELNNQGILVSTIVSPNLFKLCEEVTFSGNIVNDCTLHKCLAMGKNIDGKSTNCSRCAQCLYGTLSVGEGFIPDIYMATDKDIHDLFIGF